MSEMCHYSYSFLLQQNSKVKINGIGVIMNKNSSICERYRVNMELPIYLHVVGIA